MSQLLLVFGATVCYPDAMSLTRKALDECLVGATADLEIAPADGMLCYLIECVSLNKSEAPNRRDVEVVAVAYAKALQKYTRA